MISARSTCNGMTSLIQLHEQHAYKLIVLCMINRDNRDNLGVNKIDMVSLTLLTVNNNVCIMN